MVQKIKNFCQRLHQDTSGAMSVEMILLVALIALPIVILLFLFRAQLVTWFKGQASQVNDPGTQSLQ